MSSSIPRFMLADLTAEQLSQEMVRMAQASAPEWKNITDGDPGKAIIDAVAWMGSTILYRVNLLPRRQRLEFLRLLGLRLRASEPARGVVQLGYKKAQGAKPVLTEEGTRLPGPIAFETRSPLTVQPFEGRVYHKRTLEGPEVDALREVIDDLAELYGIEAADPYATTELFEDGRTVLDGIDPFSSSVDRTVWIALLALDDTEEAMTAALAALDTQPALLNVGVIPRVKEPDPDPDTPAPVMLDHFEWAISSRTTIGSEELDSFLVLQTEDNRTEQMAREGTLRLILPSSANVAAPENDLDADTDAGLGDRPPRVDDPDVAPRIVAWIRLRPLDSEGVLPLSWLGINAAMIEGRETRRQIQIGVSNGRPAQVVPLPASDVDPESFVLSVQESGRGFVRWYPTEDLWSASRDDRVFQLDPAAGTVSFGDGLTGRLPERGARIRVDFMRSGGGPEGNVAAGTLAKIEKQGLDVRQPGEMTGGRAAETLEQAEKRVTAWLQHNDRCVTADDYRAIASELELGRIEVLPRLRPYQLRADSPGVVSVMVLPQKAVVEAPNPRPDRRLIERVRAHLEPRRPLGTELFTIAPEYVPIGVAVAINVREGFVRELVVQDVRTAIYDFLWPLSGGGRDGAGWPLGQSVLNLEAELIAARVPGVLTGAGTSIFRWQPSGFVAAPTDPTTTAQTITLEPWQLPECLQVDVLVGATAAPTSMEDRTGLNGSGSGGDGSGGRGTAVPVVPEIC